MAFYQISVVFLQSQCCPVTKST